MKHYKEISKYILLLMFLATTIVNAQEITTNNTAPNVGDTVTYTVTSGNYASYFWEVSSGGQLGSNSNRSTVITWQEVGTHTVEVELGLASGSYYFPFINVTVSSSLSAGSIGSAQTICNNDDPALLTSITDASGSDGSYAYQWQFSNDGSTNWTDITGATSSTYDPPSGLTVTRWYRRGVTSYSETLYTTSVEITINPSPGLAIGSGTTITGPGSTTLTATPGADANNIRWYDASTGGNLLVTGISYTTPTLNATTTYYVASYSDATGCEDTDRQPIIVTVTADACGVPQSERDALLALYNATDGDNWTNTLANNQPWDINIPVCDWYGVTVENGNVTKLILQLNKLSGNIPAELQYLTYLKELNLDRNTLGGSIPTELRYLTNLEILSLSYNNFIGTIPIELEELINLKHLGLNNYVSVGIESGVRIVEGQLTGHIPTQLGNLTNLEFLGVYGNRLSGEIPDVLASIATLDTLYFGYNKFIFSDFEDEHTSYSNNLTHYYYSPQDKVDQEETISVSIGSDSPQLSTSLNAQYNTYQWQFSADGGETYTDIVGANGHDYIITNATVEDQGLYRLIINNTIVTGLTLERYPITILVGNSNSICTYGLEEPTIADLLPNGSNIEWYTSETGGSPLSSSGEIVTDAVNIEGVNYWWDDITDNITTRTVSVVYVDNKTPEADINQLFSIYAASTIGDIEIYNSGEPVYWYASDSSTTSLDASTLLVSGETYYASSCDETDDTCSCRLPVTVTLGILPPKGDEVQYLCENSTINDIVLELESGMSAVWYEFILINSSSNGPTTYTPINQLNGSTLLTNGKTYYAVQMDSNGVEGQNYLEVSVDLSTTPAPVVLETTQTFYANESQTVGDLQAFGNDIKWYSQEVGGNVYETTTALEDGVTYYAEQNGNNTCPSTSRVAVTVELSLEVADPLLGCELFRPELLGHYVIDAWLNEREVTSQIIDQVPFNDSPESELFVDLLNHLKNRFLSTDNQLHDIPDVYEPVLSVDETQSDFALLIPFIEDLDVSEKKLIVYDFEPINDDYGRAIGFSFYLNEGKTKQVIYRTPTFTYEVPRTTATGVEKDIITEHYTLLDNIDNTSNDFLNFTRVEVSASGELTIYSDFNQTTPPAYQESQEGALSDIGVMKYESVKYEYTEVAYQSTPTYDTAKIEVSFVDVNNVAIGTSVELAPQGSIIDKWQKVTADFVIPSNAGKMIIAIKNTDENNFAYFDDIRIHPFESNMKTFVYHPENQRLMSELDENNYATFYEYDLEGGLVRVKKETEKGIYTIQETRSGNVKTSN